MTTNESLSVVLLDGNDPEEENVRVALYSETNDNIFKEHILDMMPYNDKKSCDMELKFKDTVYFVHSLKLRMASPFFDEKIKALEAEEKLKSSVSLPVKKENLKTVRFRLTIDLKMEESIFSDLIKYIYKGKIRGPIKGTELQYFKAAKELQLKELVEVYRGYMATYFTPLDACKVVEYAQSQKYAVLYEMCIRLIGTHAGAIFLKQAHIAWSKSHMLNIAQSPNLNVEEFELYKAIVNYIDRYVDKSAFKDDNVDKKMLRKELWQEFEPHIRWGQIEPDVLYKEVEMKNPFISSSMLNESYKWAALGGNMMDDSYLYYFNNLNSMKPRIGGGLRWVFDPKRCNNNLTITHKGRRVKHNSGSGHSSVMGNKGYKTGNHKIQIKILGQSHWVGIGMIFPSNATTTLTNDYSYFYGASSANQRYQTAGNLTNWQTGDIIQMHLKFTKKTCQYEMSVLGKVQTLLTATIPMGNEALFPIVNLYSTGNEIELIKP